MTKYYFILSVSILLNVGCDHLQGASDINSNVVRDIDGKIVSGTVTQYKNNVIHSIRNVSDYKLNGKSTIFQKDGKTLKTEIFYKQGKKHGQVKSYYSDGSLYRSYNYKNGLLDGEQKKYRQSGKLSAESFYRSGQPDNSLKEYLVNGEPKKNYPKIIVRNDDKTFLNGQYKVKVTLSDKSQKVEYYLGKLDKEGFIPMGEAIRMGAKNTGYFEIIYNLGPGQFVVEKLNIIAKVKTKQGNYYFTTKTHNVAAENRL